MSTNIDAKKLIESKIGTLSFGGYMRSLRATMDLNQVEMAKFLKISKSTLCDIEKGRQLVSPALAAKIAKKCDDSLELAISLSLQDQVRKAKLDFKVYVA
jgi:DNA-binding XRE family transcriptional regulator